MRIDIGKNVNRKMCPNLHQINKKAIYSNFTSPSIIFIFIFFISGYNVFALSIILELIEEIEPYTFKRFQYLRV
jgi:hypothetical protein